MTVGDLVVEFICENQFVKYFLSSHRQNK